MAKPDREWLLSSADVLINLSAGWFALVFIASNAIDEPLPETIRAIASNIGLGIFSLWTAVKLRKLLNDNEEKL